MDGISPFSISNDSIASARNHDAFLRLLPPLGRRRLRPDPRIPAPLRASHSLRDPGAPVPPTEPPKPAGETIRGNGAIGPSIGPSLVRLLPVGSPRTPRTGGKFSAGARNRRTVSATPDYMAERVGFEPTVLSGSDPSCADATTDGSHRHPRRAGFTRVRNSRNCSGRFGPSPAAQRSIRFSLIG